MKSFMMKKRIFLISILVFISIYTFGQTSFSLSNPLNNDESVEQLKSIQINSRKYAKRFRPIAINPAIQKNNEIAIHDTIIMELFPEEQFKGVIEKITEINGNSTYRAKITGHDYSWAFISSDNGKTLISIEIADENKMFRVEYDNESEQHLLIDVDLSKRN